MELNSRAKCEAGAIKREEGGGGWQEKKAEVGGRVQHLALFSYVRQGNPEAGELHLLVSGLINKGTCIKI